MAKEISFESEFILHTLTQENLKELFDLELVASEIQLNDLRIDNLAFDIKTKTFVIIEYKNEFNINVLNQTQKYYDLIQDNKKYFIDRLENVENVNFENTKIMIISPKFIQKQIKESKSYFELWKVTLFDDGKVNYKNLQSNELKILNIDLEDLKLTEDKLLNDKSNEIIELYKNFQKKLLNEFDDLDMKFLADGVSIKTHDNYICLINVKKSIKIFYYTKELEDPENKTRNISDITTGGPLSHYELTLNKDNVDYSIDLIKQVYVQKVKK